MTEIERNADLIHLGRGAGAEIGQAVRVAVETTAPERRPVIVGKLHHAHAETRNSSILSILSSSMFGDSNE